MENKFLHTIKSCWLCLRFPFLYPRNRFDGRHHVNLLQSQVHKLYRNSILEISVTGELYKAGENSSFNKYEFFLENQVKLDKDNRKLYIENRTEKKEFDISKLDPSNKFEILGIKVVFAFGGNPIVKIILTPKDENDKTNYGFCYHSVKLITNKFIYFWYKVTNWIDDQVLDRIFFIPTYTELDALESGWRKAFGIQICKDLRKQLIKDHYLFKYRITQIKEKFGYLHWYDEGASKAVYDIISHYEDISANTCIVCGKPATKITGGWICPYCDDCFPEKSTVYQEKVNGVWELKNKWNEI